MRLLIDTVYCRSLGGFRLQRELALCADLRCPEDSDIVFMHAPEVHDIRESPRLTPIRIDCATGWSGQWRWVHRELPQKAREYRADVVYSLAGILPRSLKKICGTVNSVNSMLPFTPSQIRYLPLLSKDRARLLILQRVCAKSSRWADSVVVPSRHGLETLSEYAGDLADKAYIAPNPVPSYVKYEPDHPPAHPRGGKPYLFYLSAIYWYKNHLNLVEAYRRALREQPDLPDLILAGPPAEQEYLAKVCEAIDYASLGSRVKYLGEIPREDIGAWLHHATINVFPSTCETSSFIQAEILGAHGIMACSDCAPMPEIAGGAAELFDPFDPDSIARVIVRLSSDPRRQAELRRRAAERSSQLSPSACGDEIWNAVLHAHRAYLGRQSSR